MKEIPAYLWGWVFVLFLVMSDSCNPVDYSLPGSSVRGFSRQEYWSGLPFPSPGDLPDPGMEPASPALAGIFLTIEPPGKPLVEGMLTLKRLLYLRKEQNNTYSVFFRDTE